MTRPRLSSISGSAAFAAFSRFALVLLVLAALVAGPGCNWLTGTRRVRVRAKPKQGVIIECNRGDAIVYVDEQPIGRVVRYHRWPLGLKPGRHRLQIQMIGYYTRYLDLEIRPGKIDTLRVTMHRELF